MAHAEDGFGPCDSKEVLHEEEQKTQAFPLEFLALTKDGGELHRYREGLGTEELQKPVKVFSGVDQAQWTADGQKLAIVHRDRPCQVDLVGVEEDKVFFSFCGSSPVVKFCFSPLQTFLLVCFRHDPGAGQHANFCLYRVEDGEEVLSFTLKQINSNTWPPLRWTSQESYCCRMVTNEIHIFKENSFNLNHPHDRIRCENVVSFSPCREKKRSDASPSSSSSTAATTTTSASSSSSSEKRPPPPSSDAVDEDSPAHGPQNGAENGGTAKASTEGEGEGGEGGGGSGKKASKKTGSSSSDASFPLTCAVFALGKKGAPSTIKLFDLSDGSRCVASKSFFHGSEAIQFRWSYDGRAVLAQVHTDATDKSYYGSDALYFLKADGTYDCQLVTAEEGPIHDVQWSPTTLEFLVCRGPVPPEGFEKGPFFDEMVENEASQEEPGEKETR